jgi:hypothetical protein
MREAVLELTGRGASGNGRFSSYAELAKAIGADASTVAGWALEKPRTFSVSFAWKISALLWGLNGEAQGFLDRVHGILMGSGSWNEAEWSEDAARRNLDYHWREVGTRIFPEKNPFDCRTLAHEAHDLISKFVATSDPEGHLRMAANYLSQKSTLQAIAHLLKNEGNIRARLFWGGGTQEVKDLMAKFAGWIGSNLLDRNKVNVSTTVECFIEDDADLDHFIVTFVDEVWAARGTLNHGAARRMRVYQRPVPHDAESRWMGDFWVVCATLPNAFVASLLPRDEALHGKLLLDFSEKGRGGESETISSLSTQSVRATDSLARLFLKRYGLEGNSPNENLYAFEVRPTLRMESSKTDKPSQGRTNKPEQRFPWRSPAAWERSENHSTTGK